METFPPNEVLINRTLTSLLSSCLVGPFFAGLLDVILWSELPMVSDNLLFVSFLQVAPSKLESFKQMRHTLCLLALFHFGFSCLTAVRDINDKTERQMSATDTFAESSFFLLSRNL